MLSGFLSFVFGYEHNQKDVSNAGCFECIFIARRPNYWLLCLCYQGFCHLFSVTNTTKRMVRMQTVSNAFLLRDGLTFGYYVCVTKVSVICVRLRTQPKTFQKLKCKKSIFLFYGKILVIQFSYMKNNSPRPFVQLSVLMELHEKCMISIFPYMKIVWLTFSVNPGSNDNNSKKMF